MAIHEQLLVLLSQATPEDVTAIDAEMAKKQAELDGLAKLRKVLAANAGVAAATPAKPAPNAARREAEETKDMRCSIATFLRSKQPAKAPEIVAALGMPKGDHRIYNLLLHPWFHKSDEGYRLTPEGNREAP